MEEYEEHIVEFDYTIVQANSYTHVVCGGNKSREEIIAEAERVFHQEIAGSLEPYDRPTIQRRYVERRSTRPRGEGLLAHLSPALQAIPD